MQSLTEQSYESMPGYHFARIVASSLTVKDPAKRAAIIESARVLLERGDK
jgi:hypothetical protein